MDEVLGDELRSYSKAYNSEDEVKSLVDKLIEDNKSQLLAAAKRGCTGFNISHPGDYVCILCHQSKVVAEYITSKYKLNINVTQGGINGYGDSVTLSWAEEPDVKNCDFNALR